jgi:hypothetical protein
LFDVAAPMGRGGMRRRKGDSWRLIFPALFHLDDPELAQVASTNFALIMRALLSTSLGNSARDGDIRFAIA